MRRDDIGKDEYLEDELGLSYDESDEELDYDEADEEFDYDDSDDYADQTVGRKRKKRRKKHYFRNFVIVVVVLVAAYFILTSSMFTIKMIDVSGNVHFTKDQIIEMSGIKQGNNMFKTNMGRAEARIIKDSYIEDVQIKRKPLHRVVIDIVEHREALAIGLDGGKYAIADFDGTVLAITKEPPHITIVENLNVKEAKKGSPLTVDRNTILTDTLKMLEAVDSGDLYFKRVIASDVAARAYIYDGLSVRGGSADIAAAVPQLRAVVVDLESRQIERGTIIVSGSGEITFTPEENG